MKRFAVIGQPIAHSLSPRIHRDFGDQTGIELSYEAIEVAPEVLGDQLASWHEQGYDGLNVTLPHKTAVLEHCTGLSERAQGAEAVNTLCRRDDGWYGDNTDGEGLLRDLVDNLGVTIADRRVLVLGAGGAARGILLPLLERRPAELALSNRTPWKPQAIAENLADRGPIRPTTHLALKGDQFDLVINAMSVGHSGQFPRLPDALFSDDAIAYDLSYGAAHTPFAEWARAHGATAVHDGLGMLVEQAAVSFHLWNEMLPRTDAVIATLRSGDEE